MSRLTFREVGEADYEEVMQMLPGAWEGRDYLPDKYLQFVADPDCRCFVCELDGKMIGFHAALIVDDGEMMMRIGGRVKVTHQGHGVYHALQRHMYTAHREYPSLKRECIILQEGHADRVRDKYVKQMGYSEVEHKKRYLYVFESGEVMIEKPKSLTSNMKELAGSDLEELFSSDTQKARLFPDGRIYMHCKPFKTVSSNIRHFTHKSVIFATMDATMSANENRRCFPYSVSLLTIGNYYNQLRNKSLHYNIELYGEDLDVFQDHFQLHFAHAQSLTKGDIELFVHAYVSVDVTRLDDVIAKYGVTRNKEYVESIRMFERPFSLALKEAEEKMPGEFNL